MTELINSAKVSFEKAMEIAVSRAGGGAVEEIELEYENDLLIYDVIIKSNNRRYEITIDAVTGAVIEMERL
ncbi:MAG: PepSY domain-containing protein [Treponema sp.]|nr:PepSY domain-containing protein [Treponema sp.]